MKKTLYMLLMVAVLLFALPAAASAASSGTCGENVNWTLDEDGNLTFSGTGKIYVDPHYVTHYIGGGTVPEIPLWVDVNSSDWEYGTSTSGYAVEVPEPVLPYGKDIRTVEIMQGITGIGGFPFYECDKLTDITIPDSVTSIGTAVFEGCSAKRHVASLDTAAKALSKAGYGFWYDEYPGISLRYIYKNDEITGFSIVGVETSTSSLVIPNIVTEIDKSAFSGCDSLTSVTIPDSVTGIADYAFSNCGSLTSIQVNDNNQQYRSADGVLFTKDMTTLIRCPRGKTGNYRIPDGVTSIGNSAFSGCTGLTGVTIPGSVIGIGDSAFHSCSGLTDVSIADGVASIGDSAFKGCNGLTSVTIPDSVTSIGKYAFDECLNIKLVFCFSNSISFGPVVFSAKAKPHIYCFENSNVAAWARNNNYSVSYLAESAPADSSEIVSRGACGENVTWTLNKQGTLVISGTGTMTDYSYYSPLPYGKGIRSVEIMQGVTSIGEYAFNGCSNLTDVTIPDSVTSIGNSAFSYCSNLIDVTIPHSVTSIGDSAFSYCSNLTSITIPDGVASIGNQVFFGCSSLTSITFPDSITSIGYEVFYNCNAKRFVVSLDNAAKVLHKAGYSFRLEQYPDISLRFVYDNDEITGLRVVGADRRNSSIVIPNFVTHIDRSAFYGAYWLTSITIPDSVIHVDDNAFYGCSVLTSVIIPGSITDAHRYVFEYCSSLTSIQASEDNQKYKTEDGVLFTQDMKTIIRCPNSKTGEYQIPNGVTGIGEEAFKKCAKLSDVTIPEGVTIIGGCAFEGCSSLASVTIPQSVKTIQHGAFGGCSSLTEVTLPFGLTSIDGHLFENCTKLERVTIPDSVVNIDWHAFQGCTSLKRVAIPPCAFSIGGYAFEGCSSLKNVSIPSGLLIIRDYAFKGCSSLTSITVPESVTRICDGAFQDCSGMTKMFIYPKQLALGEKIFTDDTPLIYCYEFSDADDWATENNYPVFYMNYYGGDATGATDFALSASEMWIAANSQSRIGVSFVPEGKGMTIQFSSSNTGAANVSAKGVLTAYSPGNTVITAVGENGVKHTCLVHVCYPATAIQMTPESLVIGQLTTAQLTAKVTTKTQSFVNQLVTWSSSDQNVAVVNENGLVTALGGGSAVITAAAYSGVSASTQVIVIPSRTLTLPSGLTRIESEAFAELLEPTMIVIPASVKFIADDAFSGSNVVISAPAGSYAETWASGHGVAFVAQ